MKAHHPILIVVALSSYLCGCAVPARHEGPAARSASAELARAASARVDAARTLTHMLEQRYLANEPLTPDFLERWAASSTRLRDAELAVAGDNDDAAIAAAQRHVQSCQKILHDLERRTHPHPLGIATQRYYVTDAEYRLAEIKRRSE